MGFDIKKLDKDKIEDLVDDAKDLAKKAGIDDINDVKEIAKDLKDKASSFAQSKEK